MNPLQRLRQQMATIWAGMSPARRAALVVVAAVVIVGAGVVAYYSSQTEYRVLCSGLTVEESGAITSKLQGQSVPYKLAAGGTAILVPAEQLAQVRVSLANDGLSAHGGKGFEIFDESSLGMTPFVQNVNYSRALQAELARSIAQMDPVASARVHIVRPEQSSFVRDQKPTTAGVVLRLKPGASLNRSAAQAIAALVAHSVEGLAVENVTLMDTTGRLLSDLSSADGDGVPNTQLAYRRELEQYLASKAEELLGKSLGFGKIIVKVAADVNFKKLKEHREIFNPEDRIVISEHVTNSNSKSGSDSPRGVAGVASNTGKSGPSAGGNSGSSKDEKNETEYTVPKTIQDLEDRMGHIERLTVAAMIDLSGVEGSNIDKDKVEALIKQAVGFKELRDKIEVSEVKLPSALPPEEPDEEAVREKKIQGYILMARNIAIGLSAVLGFMAFMLFLRRLRPAKPKAVPAAANPGGAEAALEELTAAARQDPAALARVLAGMMGP